MQLEKAKETKQDMERCRLLAQRIAEELAPATAAVLNAETPALEKALHRAGVDANPFTVAARQADLLVVEDPAWVEMPAQMPGQVLLVFTGSNVAEGWAEELARRGYYRDFRWRSRGRAQQSALYCTVQPATAEMIAGYEKELDLLRDRMVRAERTCNEEAALIERLRSDLSLPALADHAQEVLALTGGGPRLTFVGEDVYHRPVWRGHDFLRVVGFLVFIAGELLFFIS